MRTVSLTRGAAGAFTIIALSGCGNANWGAPPGPLSRVAPLTTQIARWPSLRGMANEDLLYVSGGPCQSGTCIYSYPAAKLVGQVTERSNLGLCSDGQGNVFMPNLTYVYEYAHGGSEPIATLGSPSGYYADACGVDPTTGNLAVTVDCYCNEATVAIYSNAQGPATIYDDTTMFYALFCGYDDKGDLFIDGIGNGGSSMLAELPKGASSFTNLSLYQYVGYPGQIQWDGKHITQQDQDSPGSPIYRLKVSGSTATIVGVTQFKETGGPGPVYQSWIQGNRVVIPFQFSHSHYAVGFWKYPKGGNRTKTISHGFTKATQVTGVTVSVGNSRHYPLEQIHIGSDAASSHR